MIRVSPAFLSFFWMTERHSQRLRRAAEGARGKPRGRRRNTMASASSFVPCHSRWACWDTKEFVLPLRRHGVRRRNEPHSRLAVAPKIRTCHVGSTAEVLLQGSSSSRGYELLTCSPLLFHAVHSRVSRMNIGGVLESGVVDWWNIPLYPVRCTALLPLSMPVMAVVDPAKTAGA